MPLRVFRNRASDRSPFRASPEITSPTVAFCAFASSLAAASTSSSIDKVVRIRLYIKHHTSDALAAKLLTALSFSP